MYVYYEYKKLPGESIRIRTPSRDPITFGNCAMRKKFLAVCCISRSVCGIFIYRVFKPQILSVTRFTILHIVALHIPPKSPIVI